MIGTSTGTLVFACIVPIDMRKSFDTLAAIVRNQLQRDPLSGEMFLFFNKSRTHAKVLFWDGSGLCILSKRIEGTRFARLRVTHGGELLMSREELNVFLKGSQVVERIPSAKNISPLINKNEGATITPNAASSHTFGLPRDYPPDRSRQGEANINHSQPGA